MHFAEAASKTIGQLEKAEFENTVPSQSHFVTKNASAAERLIRTSCKALAPGADEKSGVYGQFKVFYKSISKRT